MIRGLRQITAHSQNLECGLRYPTLIKNKRGKQDSLQQSILYLFQSAGQVQPSHPSCNGPTKLSMGPKQTFWPIAASIIHRKIRHGQELVRPRFFPWRPPRELFIDGGATLCSCFPPWANSRPAAGPLWCTSDARHLTASEGARRSSSSGGAASRGFSLPTHVLWTVPNLVYFLSVNSSVCCGPRQVCGYVAPALEVHWGCTCRQCTWSPTLSRPGNQKPWSDEVGNFGILPFAARPAPPKDIAPPQRCHTFSDFKLTAGGYMAGCTLLSTPWCPRCTQRVYRAAIGWTACNLRRGWSGVPGLKPPCNQCCIQRPDRLKSLFEMAWREILAGDGVAWREISQKLSFCTEWEENRHFLAAPALHTTEIECIFWHF